MASSVNRPEELSLSLERGSLADRVGALLRSLPADSNEHTLTLDELSLKLGLRLPDLAQTATYWQRGELGRRLRRLGYGIRVEYGRVVFTGGGVEVPIEGSESIAEPHTGKGAQRVVLVVDDDAALCQFIADALEPEGYKTVRAGDGQAALTAVEVAAPDLILLDVHLPGTDGWDVLQQLRAKAGPHRSIVVMTGQYEGQEQALGSGAQGYLAKPFDLDDLLECVDLHSSITMEANLTERLGTLESGHQP